MDCEKKFTAQGNKCLTIYRPWRIVAALEVPTMAKPHVDIRIEGTAFYQIYGNSQPGTRWIDLNVQMSQDGQAFTDDTRCAVEIAEGATQDGLAVAVNGNLYLAGGLRGKAA